MESLIVTLTGAVLYGLTELLWRGWTHWSMLLCGGLCFLLMYRISAAPLPLPGKWLLSAAAITAVEFAVGCAVNLALHWQVWDYSALRWNLLGQICPLFSLYWLLLSIPGTALCALLRRLLRQ